ncbi:hypothetical protein E2C01_006825 [Portunus trituberculatus]|uniref:Uncharacterized protein n=1 Tax=Portunus trituberculatus TaxID=210409 RepID=A0A5B7CWE1_PORTR|nr:hypothetical protein [Portunus trituberculatus]
MSLDDGVARRRTVEGVTSARTQYFTLLLPPGGLTTSPLLGMARVWGREGNTLIGALHGARQDCSFSVYVFVFNCVLSECCISESKELSCLTSLKGGEEKREVHLGISWGYISKTNTWVHIRRNTSPRTPYLGHWWDCMNLEQCGTAGAI